MANRPAGAEEHSVRLHPDAEERRNEKRVSVKPNFCFFPGAFRENQKQNSLISPALRPMCVVEAQRLPQTGTNCE